MKKRKAQRWNDLSGLQSLREILAYPDSVVVSPIHKRLNQKDDLIAMLDEFCRVSVVRIVNSRGNSAKATFIVCSIKTGTCNVTLRYKKKPTKRHQPEGNPIDYYFPQAPVKKIWVQRAPGSYGSNQ